MADNGDQAPHRAQPQGPRPPDALRDALSQAGYAVRRAPPAAGAPDDAPNDGSLRQAEAQPRRPEVRPRSDALPSHDGSVRQASEARQNGSPPIAPNDGNLRQQGGATPSGARPTVRPPVRRPAVRSFGGAAQSGAAAETAAASSDVRDAGAGHPHSDDSQTGKYFPPDAPGREVGRRTDSGASRMGGASESLADRRPMPELEDDLMESHRSVVPATDELLEAPEPEEAIQPARGATPIKGKDAARPEGPDYGDMRTVIVASLGVTEKLRERRRRSDLAKDSELDEAAKEEIISKAGRLKVASAETQQEYLAVGRRLVGRFKRESDIHDVPLEDLDPREFANWLLGLKPFITRNTWRKYRASAIAIVQTIPSTYLDDAVAMLNQDLQVGDDDAPVVQTKKKSESDTGASNRAKRIEHHHFQQLKLQLRVTTRSQAQAWLRDWMEAGINTGLRPMEWALTSLERRPDRRYPNGRVWLHVVSAKAADGRATHRTLDLSNFSTGALEAVERMVNRSREWVLSGQWSYHQHEVAKLFRTMCQRMFPRMQKQYTLYSLRHQFIANMKTIYSREEVAAMVGHISIETQVEHYGKKRVAWDSNLIAEVPMPVEEQVAHIRKRLALFEVRRADVAQ